MSKWFAPWRGTFAYSRDESRQFAPFGSQKQDGRKEMQDSERIMLSAVEKWTKYGRFPYKLILHSTILMLVTIQLLSILVQFTEPVSSGENLFAKLFLDQSTAAETLTLFTVEEMLKQFSSIVDTYYDINNSTVYYYTPDEGEDGDPQPIEMIVEWHPDYIIDAPLTLKQVYYLDDELPLGPMNGTQEEAKAFLNHSQTITLRFVLNDDVAATQFGPAPMTWTIDLLFINAGGIFTAELWTVRHIKNNVFLHRLGFIPALIILVSTISLGLGIKAVISTLAVLRRTKVAWNMIPTRVLVRAYREINAPGVLPIYLWSDIPFVVKLDFFSSWNAMECVGEISLIIGCIFGFLWDHGLPVSDQARLFIGIGSMILCINFIKYLEYWKKFSALILTIQGSFLRNLRFVVSVVPLYMGFVVCGYVMFSPYSPYFASIDTTAVTLFALINGDDTHAIFGNLRENYPYPKISQAYLFSFDMLFITLVLNVFLYIIEDAYQAAAVWINNAAEKLSRSHRHMRADTPLPRGWKPTPGSVDFDIPVLFRVLEKSQQILKKAGPKLDSSSMDLGDAAFFSSVESYDEATSHKMEVSKAESRHVRGPPTDDFRRRNVSHEQSHSSDDSTQNLLSGMEMDETAHEDGDMSGRASPEEISSPEALQSAIEIAVAASQQEFHKHVEVTIKAMQDDYSARLQRQVAEIVARSTTALRLRSQQIKGSSSETSSSASDS